MKKIILLAALISVFPVTSAFADACSEDCPSGQHKVSFGDGDTVSCVCSDQQQAMQEGDPGSAEFPGPEHD